MMMPGMMWGMGLIWLLVVVVLLLRWPRSSSTCFPDAREIDNE
jgi:tellurite resistance protein TehA-like permease